MFVFLCVHVSFFSVCFSCFHVLCSSSWLSICPVFIFVFPCISVSFLSVYVCPVFIFMFVCPMLMVCPNAFVLMALTSPVFV